MKDKNSKNKDFVSRLKGTMRYVGLMPLAAVYDLSIIARPAKFVKFLTAAAVKFVYKKYDNHAALEKDGLLHITGNKETQDAIAASKHLRSIANKKIYFFNGVPDYDLFNMQDYGVRGFAMEQTPERILYAVRVRPTRKQEKSLIHRPYMDDAVIYSGKKGDKKFRFDEVEKVQLVLDVGLDEVGAQKFILRERTQREMELSPDKHEPSLKVKNFIAQQKTDMEVSFGHVRPLRFVFHQERQLNSMYNVMLKHVKRGIKADIAKAQERVSHSLKRFRNERSIGLNNNQMLSMNVQQNFSEVRR